ncbi:MAG: hypothetical protein HY554_12440, partial [Elusimicrobia bacterium]|nr:hypothetical protein [Elusimicrobiota bacterium]
MSEAERDPDDALEGLRRREFLQLLAASFAAAGCGQLQPPKEKIVPALDASEDALAGRAAWYATQCPACPAGCGALAKVRDGRPIKLEGNPDHPVSRGGLCARGQASILDLYDSRRFASPLVAGEPASWERADAEVGGALLEARRSGRKVRVLAGSWPSPTARAVLGRFAAAFPGSRRLAYDPLSYAAIARAHGRTHGRAVLPTFHLEKARALVALDADFLGTWLSPMEFTKGWAANRKPDSELDLMSWHAQFESRLSLTGANADFRVPLRPSERYGTLAELGRLVGGKLGWTGPLPPMGGTTVSRSVLSDVADMLVAERRRALLLCGADDAEVQVLANWINHMLAAYEEIIDLSRPSRQAEGEPEALESLIAEMERGEVGVLLVLGRNPAYDHPRASAFRAAAGKVACVVSLARRRDETSELARVVCPDLHPLEAWGDSDAHAGVVSIAQPVVAPLFGGRPALESLARWAGRAGDAHALVRETWRREVFPAQAKGRDFETFWEETLKAGAVAVAAREEGRGAFSAAALAGLAAPQTAPGVPPFSSDAVRGDGPAPAPASRGP